MAGMLTHACALPLLLFNSSSSARLCACSQSSVEVPWLQRRPHCRPFHYLPVSVPIHLPGHTPTLHCPRNPAVQIPIALATAAPERRVRPALEALKMNNLFDAVVTAEDNGAAETEYYYMLASNQIQRPFVRCIVVGDSNRSVEAAHELGMKSVVVTGGQPAWNFSSADLVVRSLNQLSFVNMKKLIGQEELVEHEPQMQLEEEHEPQHHQGSLW